MNIIALILLTGLCFGKYSLESFEGIGLNVEVPPPMWMEADGHGDGAEINETKHSGFKLYEFIPSSESWDKFTMTYGITFSDISGFQGSLDELVINYIESLRDVCQYPATVIVPKITKNTAIIVSGCGEVYSGVRPVLDNKGDIIIVYIERKGDRLITVYSEYVVSPFTSVFINQWPISQSEIAEAIRRLQAIKVIESS